MPTTGALERSYRGALTRDVIARAAIRVADASSPEAVSLRRVAAELGVTAMALYRHVDGVEDLRNAMVEAAASAFDLEPSPTTSDWPIVLGWSGLGFFDLLTANPVVLDAFLRQPVTSPRTRELGEPVFAALAEAGFSAEDAADAYRSVLALAVGFGSLHHKWHADGSATRSRERAVAKQIRSSARAEGLPHMARAAGFIASSYPRDQFERALAYVIEGIRAHRRR